MSDSGHYSLDDGAMSGDSNGLHPADYPYHGVVVPPNQAVPVGGGALLEVPQCRHCQRDLRRPVRDYLPWSIAMVILAPPFGCLALISSLQTRRLLRQDPNSPQAIRKSQMAFNSNAVGMFCMVLMLLAVVITGLLLRDGILHANSSRKVPTVADETGPRTTAKPVNLESYERPKVDVQAKPDSSFIGRDRIILSQDLGNVSKPSLSDAVKADSLRQFNGLTNGDGMEKRTGAQEPST